MSIDENYKNVCNQIQASVRKWNRKPEAVKLLAVSKTKPIAALKAVVELGQRDFGENYAQELAEKKDQLADIRFHFIGHLQRNKIKLILGKAELIHSIDRLILAQDISDQMIEKMPAHRQKILLQLHIGDEETKSGVSPEKAVEIGLSIAELPGILLCGIMALPPLTDSIDKARKNFSEAYEIYSKILQSLPDENKANFTELSMGTSQDFDAAIAEGATLVRVGTSIFGARS